MRRSLSRADSSPFETLSSQAEPSLVEYVTSLNRAELNHLQFFSWNMLKINEIIWNWLSYDFFKMSSRTEPTTKVYPSRLVNAVSPSRVGPDRKSYFLYPIESIQADLKTHHSELSRSSRRVKPSRAEKNEWEFIWENDEFIQICVSNENVYEP